MQEQARVPAIRFAGFTDAWEQCKLGQIATEIKRNDPESQAPIMMITAENGFIEQSKRYAFNNAGESLKKYILLQKGELAYNHGASQIRPFGSCFSLTTVESARIPFVYHCFSVGENNSEFVSIELNGKEVENQLRQIVSSGARMDGLLNISYDEYSGITLRLPETAEQCKISEFVRHLDHLITLHQRKYSRLCNVKKSMLEKMFPKDGASMPEIRFAGFTDAWEQRKLKEVTALLTGFPFESKEFTNSGIKLVRGMNVKRGYLDFSENLCEYWDSSKGLENYLLEGGDILIQMDGALIGKSYAKIAKNQLPALLVQRVTRARVLTDKADEAFIYQEIQKRFLPYIKRTKTETAVPHLSLSNIADFSIMIPSIDEQKQIGDFFENLDHLITLHQRELERLQNIKKACLEKMFI